MCYVWQRDNFTTETNDIVINEGSPFRGRGNVGASTLCNGSSGVEQIKDICMYLQCSSTKGTPSSYPLSIGLCFSIQLSKHNPYRIDKYIGLDIVYWTTLETQHKWFFLRYLWMNVTTSKETMTACY